jgi:hypothetical protein
MKTNEEISYKYYLSILEEQFNKWYNDENFNKYLIDNEDETFEYLALNKGDTGLNVRIAVDGEASFIHRGHPLWLYFSNNYIGDFTDRIPISIELNPRLLFKDRHIKILDDDIKSIKIFIIQNYESLYEYGNGNIDTLTFYERINKKRKLSECHLLTEMPILDKNVTGLDVPIWVDNVRNKQHGQRIKFKYDNVDDTRQWATMTIDDNNPVVRNLNRKTLLTNKDIEKIKQFVIYNYDILSRLSTDNTVEYKTEFLPYIIKIGKHGGAILPQTRIDAINNDDVINIDCSCIGNRIYFITNGGDDKTNIFIYNVVNNNRIFHGIDNHTFYINKNDIIAKNKNIYDILSNIKNTANNNNFKIKFTNLSRIL